MQHDTQILLECVNKNKGITILMYEEKKVLMVKLDLHDDDDVNKR